MLAPTAAELVSNSTIRDELEHAWTDSQSDDPAARHEEGGWIYMNIQTGELSVIRADPGGRAVVDLSRPPTTEGWVVVGKFHTHPNPTAEGWAPGPSDSDRRVDAMHGVPDLIRADNAICFSGPDRRRGAIVGSPGYPA
jgi:hypothetical protein